MSERVPGCFGKLPFALAESLPSSFCTCAGLWADSIPVPGFSGALMSIDSISLSREELGGSVSLAILHAMNDVYAANGIPSFFCVSTVLPSEADASLLSDINSEILRCAKITSSSIGKLHTSRASEPPSATVAVLGKLPLPPFDPPKEGVVVAVGSYMGTPLRLPDEMMYSNTMARREAATTLMGPKKDASGDGIAGALVQLARRTGVDLEIRVGAICDLRFKPHTDISERNYLDYAGFIGGLTTNSAALLEALFSPRIFGPLICLAGADSNLESRIGVPIGTFTLGHGKVRVVNA